MTLPKFIAALLAVSQLTTPVVALAQAYDYKAAVRDLRVTGPSGGTSGDGENLIKAVLTPSPATHAFGSVIVGSSSSPQTVLFKNTGLLPAFTGTAYASTDYTVSSGCDALALSPGEECTVQVNFVPTSVKNFAPGSVTIPFEYPGSTGLPTGVANFTGIGAPVPVVEAPRLSVSTSTLQFGAVTTGETTSRSVTLTNEGNQAATLQYSETGTVLQRGGTCAESLGAGESCQLILSLTPTVTGPLSGSVLVSANGGINHTAVSWQAQSSAPAVSSFTLSSTGLSFLDKDTSSSYQQDILVLNTGTTLLEHPRITSTGSAFSASHNCTFVTSGNTCRVQVTFNSDVSPNYIGSLTVGFEGLADKLATLTGTLAPPVSQLDGAPVSMGNVFLGNTSRKQSFTVRNIGQAPLNISSAAFQGSEAQKFSVTGTLATSLLKGSSTAYSVMYTPTEVGPASVTLTLTTNESTYPSLAVTATGIASVASTTSAGSSSNATVTIYNSGNLVYTNAYKVGLYSGGNEVAASQTLSATNTASMSALFATLPAVGTYDVRVLDSAGALISKAVLTVSPPAYATFALGTSSSANILTNGNLTVRSPGNGNQASMGTTPGGKTAGKWYYEMQISNSTGCTTCGIGVRRADTAPWDGSALKASVGESVMLTTAYGTYLRVQDSINHTLATSPSGWGGTSPVWIGVAVDLDNMQISFKGPAAASMGPYPLNAPAGTAFMPIAQTWSTYTINANFGQSPFVRMVPAGYNLGWK